MAFLLRSIAFLSITLIFASPQSATAANGLPDGCHTATAAEIAINPALAGRPVCPGDVTAGITPATGEAKKYLKSLPRTQSAAVDANIEQLDNSFALCAANFFREFQKTYGSVTLISGYRSSAFDAKMCRNNPRCGALMNNPNPNGNHQKGLAIDVQASAGQPALWDFARQNPRFGVCFPFTGEGGGFKDTVHMILAGIPGNETRGPGCRGVTKACDGSGFDPSSISAPSPAPTSKIAEALRQFTSPAGDPQSEAMCSLPDGKKVPCSAIKNAGGGAAPSGQSAPPLNVQNNAAMQPGMCTPQFHCASNDLYYRTSTCVDQLYQNCANGCSGTACIASPISDALGAALSNVKAPTTSITSMATKTASVIDQISSIANPNAVVPTSVTTNLIITVSAEDAARLQQSHLAQQPVELTPGTYTLSPISQETFISSDLRPSAVSASHLSNTQQILAAMKETILHALQYLRPFGSRMIYEEDYAHLPEY